ncbi:MAG: DUF4340 domain-containing protein [Clostridia bacterium]|nr:DUF4340 domain-containing protein [Clostridia bacterium]
MKLYRNAIILVVVLGLLIGAYVILKNKEGSSDTAQAGTTETKEIEIINIGSEKAKEITIEGKDGKLVLEKKDKEWVLVQAGDIKTDKTLLEGLVSDAASLKADKVVEEKAADLSKYGLSSPSVIVSVKAGDGTVKVFELGNQTPLKDGYYVRLKDSDKVYTIGSYTGDKFLKPKNSIRDKKLFQGTVEDITAFSMEKAGKVVFASKKAGDEKSPEWKLTAPIEGNADENGLGPMMEATINATISDFVEDNAADLDKYGLKNPTYALELETTKGGKTKVLLGKLDNETGSFYARLDGKNSVFSIQSSLFNFLDKPLKEVVEIFVYMTSIWDVKQIVVDIDGQTTVCDVQASAEGKEKDTDKFTVNGKDASMKDENDEQPFRKYYQALIGIEFDELETGKVPLGKPEITITYHLKKEPGVMKVEFIPKDDKSYYVFRNGKYTNLVVAKKTFDEPEGVRDSYKKLMEAINKK